jgi:hypothetical protein
LIIRRDSRNPAMIDFKSIHIGGLRVLSRSEPHYVSGLGTTRNFFCGGSIFLADGESFTCISEPARCLGTRGR